MEQHDVLGELEQIAAAVIEVGRATSQRFLRDCLDAERRHERFDGPLDQVLIHAAPFVQLS